MFMCACCRQPFSLPAGAPYRRTDRCPYCSGFPYARDGSCLGVHGEALELHLDDLVANGFWTRELADWWQKQDRRRLQSFGEASAQQRKPVE